MTGIEKGIYNRSELLLGEAFMEYIGQRRVIIFGVGGVGSWCAESLVRSGIRHLTIVDSDRVCITNVNRQCMATTRTIGEVKVEALKERLLDINPKADITALQRIYNAESAEEFHLEEYDCAIDAIDSLQEKAHLILHATSLPSSQLLFLSSMGAALRIDPTRVRMAEFWNIKGDPLARALRNKFKRTQRFPRRKFQCVFSEEPPLPNEGEPCSDPAVGGDGWSAQKAQINGSLAHITGIFGMMLAGAVLRHFRSVYLQK